MEIAEFAFTLFCQLHVSHEVLSFKKIFVFELQREKTEHINLYISECVYIFIYVSI